MRDLRSEEISEPTLPSNFGIDKRHHIDRMMLNEVHSMVLFYNG